MERMKNGLIIPHHSQSNWDFWFHDTWVECGNHRIDTTRYVSPPSSLAFGAPARDSYALSKHPDAYNLKNGRISLWVNYYNWLYGLCQIVIGVTAPGPNKIDLTIFGQEGVWKRTRWTWCQCSRLCGIPYTKCVREAWVNNQWQYHSTVIAAPMIGTINRCGISATVQGVAWTKYWDDVIIEKLIP